MVARVNDELRARLIQSGVLRPCDPNVSPEVTTLATKGPVLRLDAAGRREASRPVLMWAWSAPREFTEEHLGRKRLKL